MMLRSPLVGGSGILARLPESSSEIPTERLTDSSGRHIVDVEWWRARATLDLKIFESHSTAAFGGCLSPKFYPYLAHSPTTLRAKRVVNQLVGAGRGWDVSSAFITGRVNPLNRSRNWLFYNRLNRITSRYGSLASLMSYSWGSTLQANRMSHLSLSLAFVLLSTSHRVEIR